MRLPEPENIKDTLEHFLKGLGLYETLLDYQAVDYYNETYSKTEPFLANTRALDIHAGILKLEAPDSVLRFEIMVNKQSMIKAINTYFRKNIVKDIVVRTGG